MRDCAHEEAKECQINAERADSFVDREAWLQLAVDWMKLAQSVEPNAFNTSRQLTIEHPILRCR